MAEQDFDLIVIGGGPGGSTVATFVAMQGHKVLLLERERFPRYHIGESLLPATIHGISTMLGVDDELRDAKFVKKLGGTLRWGKRPEPWTFWFEESKLMSGRPAYAYQVVRSKFDDILLRNAAKKGVDVREEHAVREVIFEDGRASVVRFEDASKNVQTARARFIIDASGGNGLLANRIGERIYDKFFKNMALFGYFKGGKRFDDERRRGNIISAAFNEGWIWYIPLSDELTSVGAVVPVDHVPRIKELGHEKAYFAYLDACPIIKEFLQPATRITEGEYGELRILRDFSYLNTRFWAPGVALIGDAACFIDPVFSSGVHLATYSGLLAARSINTCLAGALDETRCFDEFERRYRREYGVFYEFLLGFYEMHEDESSYFWTARKVINAEENNREAFVRLVAGLSNAGEPLFQSASEFVSSARKQGEVFRALSEASVSGQISDEMLGEARRRAKIFFRERVQLWNAQSKQGEPAQSQPEQAGAPLEAPIFDGGLVPSPDGLHWAESDA